MPDRKPEQSGEVLFFKSSLLNSIDGLEHAFPCRTGQPDEPLESLRLRLKDAFGMDAIATVKQVHGNEIIACDGDPNNAKNMYREKVDAVMTRTAGLAVGVRTADCVPVLLADPAPRAVAAVHAGWRGTVKGIVAAAVDAMREVYSSKPDTLVAAIGPHIMSCCYEVGPEVADAFEERFGSDVLRPGKGDRSYLDLGSAVKSALIDAGLDEKNIDTLDLCTYCRKDLFYSYRRDGRPTGRQLSFIYFR